jgi:sarcosine oxidase delta subunit
VKYVAERGNRIIHQETAYEIVDEHYFVNVDQMKTNVFLRSQSIDGTSIAGWSHSYGCGRVICLTPAHLKEGLFHPTTIEIIKKSVKWCLLKEE